MHLQRKNSGSVPMFGLAVTRLGHKLPVDEMPKRTTACVNLITVPLLVMNFGLKFVGVREGDGAFFSSWIDLDQLAAALANADMSPPRLPVVSNVDAQTHDDPEQIRQLLLQQIVSPVRWEDSIRRLLADHFSRFYEVGPGRVLRGLMRRIERKTASCESVMG